MLSPIPMVEDRQNQMSLQYIRWSIYNTVRTNIYDSHDRHTRQLKHLRDEDGDDDGDRPDAQPDPGHQRRVCAPQFLPSTFFFQGQDLFV